MANLLESIIPRSFQTYGFEDTMLSICNRIETFDPRAVLSYNDYSDISNMIRLVAYPTKVEATDEGLAAKYGAEAAWYGMLSAMMKGHSGGERASSSDDSYSSDAISWQWQTCSQFGFYQVANTSSLHSVLSGYINITSWQIHECDRFFDFPEMATTADVSALNKYGGWNMQPSNVMFTAGLKDPWHTIGVQSTSLEIGAPDRTTVQDIPVCNQAPADGQVFGLLYPDSYHASDIVDFDIDSSGDLKPGSNLELGLELFKGALDIWLPCFNKDDAVDIPISDLDRPTNSPHASSNNPTSINFSYAPVSFGQLFVLACLIIMMIFLTIW